MDLAVYMSGDSVIFEYMAELFDTQTMDRLFGSFVGVLEQLANDINASALGGSLLSGQDVDDVARLSIGDERPGYITAPLVFEAFETVASQYPDNRCLCYEGVWLTYSEMEARASAVAGRLVGLGVGPGVVVGLMVDRSFELVISMMSILKAGGCFLPCDPSYPDERLAIYLEDGGAIAVLVQADQAARAQSMIAPGVHIIDVEEISRGVNGLVSDPSKELKRASPLDPAYCIFTSGSTGRPKGVVINHTGLINFLEYNVEYYSITQESTSLLSITVNFDPSIMQIFTPLIVGAKLVIARPGGHMDADYLVDLMVEQSVSFFITVPALGLEYYSRPAVQNCTSLRSAMFIGEPMPMELVHLIHRNVPRGVRIYNTYGTKFSTFKYLFYFIAPLLLILFDAQAPLRLLLWRRTWSALQVWKQ